MSLDVFPQPEEHLPQQLEDDEFDETMAPGRSSPPAEHQHRLGHSRRAASGLDNHIPTKRPRLGPLDSPVRGLYRNNSSDELSPTATANQLFFSPPPNQGVVVLERSFSDDNNNKTSLAFLDQDADEPPADVDDNSSSAWSLRPLAPESGTPCFSAGQDPDCASLSSSSLKSNADRWRSNQPMSSFSSTLTERSTTGSGETEDSPLLENNNLPYFTDDSKLSKRKSNKPQNNNNNPTCHSETVDQLSARLDHWCSITNMRALKRRNNIYAEHSKSQQYNPNQEYDYSHYQLSRHVRRLQCQNAKQEVMRALRSAGATGGENSDLFDDDDNDQDQPETNSPATPTMSNTTPRFINAAAAAAAVVPPTMEATTTMTMDAIMGESC